MATKRQPCFSAADDKAAEEGLMRRTWVSSHVLVWLLVVTRLCVGPDRAPAQLTAGSISGVVTDPAGAAVPNANVQIRNLASFCRETVDNK
jgi:hypothetical protein